MYLLLLMLINSCLIFLWNVMHYQWKAHELYIHQKILEKKIVVSPKVLSNNFILIIPNLIYMHMVLWITNEVSNECFKCFITHVLPQRMIMSEKPVKYWWCSCALILKADYVKAASTLTAANLLVMFKWAWRPSNLYSIYVILCLSFHIYTDHLSENPKRKSWILCCPLGLKSYQ